MTRRCVSTTTEVCFCFFVAPSQMQTLQERKAGPVTSDPYGTPFRPFRVWFITRYLTRLTPSADTHTTNTSKSTTLLDADLLTRRAFFFRTQAQWKLILAICPFYGHGLTYATHRQLVHQHSAILRLFTATFCDDPKIFVTHPGHREGATSIVCSPRFSMFLSTQAMSVYQ